MFPCKSAFRQHRTTYRLPIRLKTCLLQSYLPLSQRSSCLQKHPSCRLPSYLQNQLSSHYYCQKLSSLPAYQMSHPSYPHPLYLLYYPDPYLQPDLPAALRERGGGLLQLTERDPAGRRQLLAGGIQHHRL